MLINAYRFREALTRFIEATQADKRDRRLSKPARELAGDLASAFTEQGKLFLAGLEQYRVEFGEAMSQKDWLASLSKAQRETLERMLGPLEDSIQKSWLMGTDDLDKFMDWAPDPDDVVSVALNVVNEEAVNYAKRIAAERVSGINDTTKAQMRSLIGRATEGGWSYNRLAKEINDRFVGYSKERSHRIAVFELRDAYEAGQRELIDQVRKRGLDMEIKWLSARDDKVRDSHRSSDSEDWQDVGFVFSSGSDRPPTDPGCRCTALYRRKK